MARNSRDDYKWLVDELLAVEEPEESEDTPEPEPAWWQEDGEGRNSGWSYGVYEDEEFDEDAALLAETPRQKRKRLKLEKKQKKLEKKQRRKKRRTTGASVLVALLEILAIFALIGWWLQWKI